MNHPFINLLLCSTSTTDKIRTLEQEIARKKRTHSEINDEPIYLSLLKKLNALTPQPTSLIDCLKCLSTYDNSSFEEAKASLTIITAAWADFFEDTFSEESNPLALVDLCLNTFDSESEFAGFILYCFNKKLPIIKTDFLHKFIHIYYSLGSYVENTYTLLNGQKNAGNELQDWLISLGKVDAEIQRFSISLLGKNSTNLEKIKSASYELSVTPENWNKLYQAFANQFILFALNYKENLSLSANLQWQVIMLDRFIKQHIESMDDPFVLLENVPSMQGLIYKSIYLSITEEKAKKILLDHKHSIWIALADYPYPINSDLEATCITRIQKKSLETVLEIEAALKCAKKLKAPVFIAESMLNALLNNDSLNESLNMERNQLLSRCCLGFLLSMQPLLMQTIKNKGLELRQVIEKNTRGDIDYFKFWDELQIHSGKAIWLARLGEKNLYTGNKYEATTWFINQQLERVNESQGPTFPLDDLNSQQPLMERPNTTTEKIKILKKCLESIQPEAYNPSDTQSMRQRVIIEYTLRSDNPRIISTVMLPLLNSDYLNWQKALLNIPDYINVIKNKQNHILLLEIFNSMSKDERVAYIMKRDPKGFSILHYFAESTMLITILNQLPKKDLLSAVRQTNPLNQSLLDYSRTYRNERSSSLSIVAILECLPEEDRLTALKEKIRRGASLLPEKDLSLIERTEYFTYLENVLKCLPEKDRLAALLQKDKTEDTSINIISKKTSCIDVDFFNAVKIMLKLLPINDRLLAVNSKNDALLLQACRDPSVLDELLQLLPENERLPAIFAKNDRGCSLLLYAIHACSKKDTVQRHGSNPVIAKPSPESLRVLVKFLSSSELINNSEYMLLDSGYTLLSYAANYHDVLQIILKGLSKSERTSVLTKINPSGFTLLQEVYNSPVAIKNILELLDHNDYLRFILIKNKWNCNLLSYIIALPENLKLVLNFLPIKDRLKAIQEHYDDSISLLEYATKNCPGSIITILEVLTKHESYVAIQETFSDGSTLLHHQNILQSHVNLKAILLQIHKDNRLAAIQAKDSDGDAVVLLAAQYPKSIQIIFELLPLPKRLEAKKTKNTSGYTLFNYAINTNSFDSLKTILKFFPKEDCFALLQEENYNDCTFLENLQIARPEFIPQLIAFLPEKDRLKVAQNVESDAIEEECQFRP